MSRKCPECGVDNADDHRSCEACGYTDFRTMTLFSSDTGKQIKINIDTSVGRSLLRGLELDDIKYASEPQFRIVKDSKLGGWSIRTYPEAKNPTCCNGAPLSADPQLLADGDIISIGPEKLKMSVRLGK